MREDFYKEFSSLFNWHWWYIGRKEIIINLLDKYYNNNKKMNILDIGCGPGGVIKNLDRFGNAYGIDLNLTAIKICRGKGYNNTCISNAEHIPFRSSFFSGVLLLDLLEHLDDENLVFKEAVRVCKPGGLIILSVPAFSFLWGNIDIVCHHKRRYTIKTIKSLFTFIN